MIGLGGFFGQCKNQAWAQTHAHDASNLSEEDFHLSGKMKGVCSFGNRQIHISEWMC